MTDDRFDSLRRAVAASPADAMVRLVLAEALAADGQDAEALGHLETLLHAGALPPQQLVAAGALAAKAGRLDLLRGCLEAARQAGLVDGVSSLQTTMEGMLAERGVARVRTDGRDEGTATRLRPEETTTFDRVGGLDEVKKVVHRMVVLPLSRPDLYARYGRKAGGGALLYGPPGCGKTLLARATAGECGCRSSMSASRT